MSQTIQDNNITGCGERLHVMLRIPIETNVEKFALVFRQNGFDVSERSERGEKTLNLVSGRMNMLDERLLTFIKLLDELNDGLPDESRAELLETRISHNNSLEYLGSEGPIFVSADGILEDDSCPEKELGLMLNVGRAFGSGGHPSTRLVIETLMEMSEVNRGQFPERVLDIGCGTGILSMISAKLGAEKVVGIDICSEALDVARDNVRTNCLEDIVEIKQAQLQDLSNERYDLIVANISPSVLFKMIDTISILLDNSGALLISGIRDRQCSDVDRRCQGNDLMMFDKKTKGSWISMLYRKG